MTKQTFSPTDRPRKRKPPPSTPKEVQQLVREIQSLLEKFEADELYKHLYDFPYDTLQGQDYQPRVSQMNSDPTLAAAGDLADEFGPRNRDAGACRSVVKELDDALKLIRSATKTAKLALGVDAEKRRGRRPGWMKTA